MERTLTTTVILLCFMKPQIQSPARTGLTQFPQTGLQSQNSHGMSIEDQNPAMTPSIQGPAQEDSVPKQSAATVEPNVFWDRAYDSLRENQPKLVEAYEKVLSRELSDAYSFPVRYSAKPKHHQSKKYNYQTISNEIPC